tara:strand:- start:199 stop:1578 length:1380 start_codon:yes stop_codon:yes gene_type:complete
MTKKNILNNSLDLELIGNQMYDLMEELFPITRSITGKGVRKSLKILQNLINLKIHEIPTGFKVFDWTVPEEWNINDAYIMNSKKEKIVDFNKSNIHVLQYSENIKKKITLDELKKHIFTLPDQPNSIPYVTSFYNKNWGFCMSHNEFLKLEDDDYFINIVSEHKNGSLTYGEFLIEGDSKEEILISTYVCHPSLCNDNLSGPVLTAFLAQYLSKVKMHYSIRFLFIPETIGAITWLALNENKIHNIVHGLVVTCVGDSGISTYKKSRDGNNVIDKVVEEVLIESGNPYKIMEFWPSGSDERQYCSPAFNLPVGSLMRTPYDMFDEYHTSDDDLSFMNKECLADSLSKYLLVIEKLNDNFKNIKLEKNVLGKKVSTLNDPVYQNLCPKCEPQLGKRKIYEEIGGVKKQNLLKQKKAIQWILNLSDGNHSLRNIQQRSGLEYEILLDMAKLLENKKLLSPL